MKMRNICILTEHVTKMYMFYSKVLQINKKMQNTDYVEFKVGSCNIALFNVQCHNKMELEPVKEILNTNMLIEIEVDNLDIEYDRLKKLKIKWCKPLTTQPWGIRISAEDLCSVVDNAYNLFVKYSYELDYKLLNDARVKFIEAEQIDNELLNELNNLFEEYMEKRIIEWL